VSYHITATANGLSLGGRVDYANASACQQAGEVVMAELPADSTWTCELSALGTGSSITAAVLMAWQRFALGRGSKLTLTQAPERLVAILTASNLDEIFAVERTLEGTQNS
jgi:anti-anti-sigma regulatory factor